MDPFVIRQARLVFPAIYEGYIFDGKKPRYNTVFENEDDNPYGEENEELLRKHQVRRRAKDGLFVTASIIPPVVTEINGMYPKLEAAYSKAEIRNIPLNRLFQDVRADLVLRPYTTTYMGVEFQGAALLEVRVKALDIQEAAVRSQFKESN